jgi:hypothetical protein
VVILEISLDVLKKQNEVDFQWVLGAPDLQTAETAVERLGVRSPGEYVIFDRRTQQVIAKLKVGLQSSTESEITI